jgi:hypothetical protein
MSDNGKQSASQITLAQVAEVVQKHYGEDIWQAVKIGLALVLSLSLKGRDNCVVLVYEGASGQGKSITIRLLMSDRDNTAKYLIRIDDFTPASFVSHAANRKSSQLEQIDLLPRVNNKMMLTKELAPLFRDDEKELRQNFARLTSVLDGNGYVTASGSHGKRGYQGRYLFNWLGATTPVPDRTFRVMAQLGNRILFYEIASEEWSEEKLMDFAQNYGTDDAIKECQRAVNDFVEGHFKAHPVNSIDAHSINIPEEITREIVRYASLISHGRVEVEYDQSLGAIGGVEAGKPEGPQRVILLLQTIVRGLALAEGRMFATTDDLFPIRHIAFSSIPRKRREVLRALLVAEGSLSSAEAEKALGVSRSTATARMKELAAIGIAAFVSGDSDTSTPSKINLATKWQWLLPDDTPLKQNGDVCGSGDPNTTPSQEIGV